MDKHRSYADFRNQPEDFQVRYKFLKNTDGAYIQRPFQGMRCDFSYGDEDPITDGIYMIWPEFLDNEGSVILDRDQRINDVGIAKMWIVSPDMRQQIHRQKAKVGVKGYFMLGSTKIAEAEITSIIGLHDNHN